MPISPVVCCREEASFSTWPARARTPKASSRQSPNTIARVAQGEPEADRQRALPLGHQLAGGVVDGGDVVGVEGVPHAERVGGHAQPDAEDLARADLVVRAARRRRRSTPQPTTCSAATNSAMPAIEVHSRRERAARARVLHAGRRRCCCAHAGSRLWLLAREARDDALERTTGRRLVATRSR